MVCREGLEMKITEIKWERYKRYKTRCRGDEMVYMITATETSLLNLETNNFIEDEFLMNNNKNLNRALGYVEKLYFEGAIPLPICISLAKQYLNKLEEANKCK